MHCPGFPDPERFREIIDMTLIAAQKRTISNLAVGLNYQLVTVTGAIDRKRQTASEHRELLLKLVLIVLPFFSDIFEACQNILGRQQTILFRTLSGEFTDKSTAFHQVEPELGNAQIFHERRIFLQTL